MCSGVGVIIYEEHAHMTPHLEKDDHSGRESEIMPETFQAAFWFREQKTQQKEEFIELCDWKAKYCWFYIELNPTSHFWLYS